MSDNHEEVIYEICDRVLEIMDEGKGQDEYGTAWTRQVGILTIISELSPMDFVAFTLLNAVIGLHEADISAETYAKCVDVLQGRLPNEWQEAQKFVRLPVGG